MKKVAITVVVFIAMLALTTPLVLAGNDDPGPPITGGCSGANCK